MLDAVYREMERRDLPDLLIMSRENMASIILASWGVELRDEEVLHAILGPTAYTEVVESNGEIVGYYSVELTNGGAFINAIQVRKGHQGRGLGTDMMRRIEDLAISHGANVIELWVQLTNRQAMGFYRHRGYRTMSRQGNNYLMRKRLF
jgi:ribosomal protein S18 acetylase RimI-like enzyme